MSANLCPGCGHPVLLRSPDGTCGDGECRQWVARGGAGESPRTAREREARVRRQSGMVEAVRAEFEKCKRKDQSESDAAFETLERLFGGYVVF